MILPLLQPLLQPREVPRHPVRELTELAQGMGGALVVWHSGREEHSPNVTQHAEVVVELVEPEMTVLEEVGAVQGGVLADVANESSPTLATSATRGSLVDSDEELCEVQQRYVY